MVKSVELELKAEERELINAANNPAMAIPFRPLGKKLVIMAGKALSASSKEKLISPFCIKAKAITPGIKKINTGSNFRYPAKRAPFRALVMSFADKARCTIYWSVHQYQIPNIGAPNNIPVQGYSVSLAGRHRLKK